MILILLVYSSNLLPNCLSPSTQMLIGQLPPMTENLLVGIMFFLVLPWFPSPLRNKLLLLTPALNQNIGRCLTWLVRLFSCALFYKNSVCLFCSLLLCGVIILVVLPWLTTQCFMLTLSILKLMLILFEINSPFSSLLRLGGVFRS